MDDHSQEHAAQQEKVPQSRARRLVPLIVLALILAAFALLLVLTSLGSSVDGVEEGLAAVTGWPGRAGGGG